MDLSTFEKFLENNNSRYISFVFVNAHEKVKELHGITDCIGFYAKNFFNTNETEFYYFYKDAIINVKFTIDKNEHTFPINVNHHKTKALSKGISLNRYTSNTTELTIRLEDETNFVLNNTNDSNDDWYQAYGDNIISLYKILN
ncbi:hypothetical protein [Psychrobacillus sp. FSL H8-0510]|uniref:hypothetical protein n=1 Tax=Psychrobacillus sp. FSL H8-0510 TaxID=2921394 RepID=UPI0030F8BD75